MGVSPFVRENKTGEYLTHNGTARLYGIDFGIDIFLTKYIVSCDIFLYVEDISLL